MTRKKSFYVYVALRNGIIMKSEKFDTMEEGKDLINNVYNTLLQNKTPIAKGERLTMQISNMMVFVSEIMGMWVAE